MKQLKKYLDRKKRGKEPTGSATATPSGVATIPNQELLTPAGTSILPDEPILRPSGEATPSNEPTAHQTTAPPNETTTPLPESTPLPNETADPPSQTILIPEAIVPSSKESNFWQKAVEALPKDYKLPEEWRTATIDGKDVVGRVESKMKECKDKQWKININGKEVVVRDVFEKTLGWVQKFVVVGDTAIQYDPGNAALPWAGFRFLVQLAVNETETYGAMLSGLERATWLSFYCSAQERLYKDYFADNDKYSDLNNAFVEDLVDLYTAILTFLIQAHKYYTKGPTARIAGAAITPSSWVGGLTRAIDDRKLHMEEYANLVHKINVHQDLKDVLGRLDIVSEYVSEEETRHDEKERREFMMWLSDVDYRSDHEANSRNILENSGHWMLTGEEFRVWKEGGKLLWLRGIPGAGKTKLTSTIINHLMNSGEDHTVAYFYCERDTQQPKKADPEEIFRAILKQLVILLPSEILDPVKAKYRKEKKDGEDHGSIRRLTLHECADFITKLTADRPVAIVIDALDECREIKRRSSEGGHSDRQDLLDLLEKMTGAKLGNIKVFLSSRDDGDIKGRLQNYPNVTIQASKNGQDILRFIETEVDLLMSRKGRLWGGENNLREDIIKALHNRADGMFRSPALQIDYLYSLDTRESVKIRLMKLPATLQELHDEIYRQISAMEEEASVIAIRALSWLLCARRQLHSRELLAAVSPGPDQLVGVDQLLHLCRNLVVLNPVSELFSLAHLSVREYLEIHKEYKDGQPHTLVAELCIKIFEPEAPRSILDQYASVYWMDHYNSRPQTEEDALTNKVANFFRNKGVNTAFKTWAKLAGDSAKALPRGDNVDTRLQDAGYKPLSVICVFGLPKHLDQWMDTTPGYSYFRDSDDMVVHLAIKWGNKEVVRLLLRQDAQPTIDKFGLTIPFWAAIYERLPVLEVLKKLHGEIDAKDEMGWTALHWMVVLGRIEGVKILLRVGAGPIMTNEAKWTPLHWAAFLGRETETKELVVEHQLDAEDRDGLTPLQWATFLGNERTTSHLRKGEASGNCSSTLRISLRDQVVRTD